MQIEGLSEKDVLKQLGLARRKDLKYSDGKILSSMCTLPHPFSRKIFRFFLETNLGDPGLFPGTKGLEIEAIKMLGSLLGNEDAVGFILSGGTEANIMALWVARNMYKKKKAEVIVSESAHFSFEKAADILGLKLVRAARGPDNSADITDVRKKISGNTIAIVGVAGSTEYGTIDDIESLSEIAVEEDLYLHVDAAFGGFVIPFLKELGYEVRDFDFSLPGVSSITIDPHKMGLAIIPSGGILFRDKSFLKYIETPSPYLTEKVQHTIVGTRSGAPAAVVYALMKLLGRKGYTENVHRCMNRTMKLYRELRKLGFHVYKPTMNILVFSHKKQGEIAEELHRRGWVVSRTKKGEIRFVIMPHVKDENITQLIEDLKEISRQ
jgi:tyrosine decarboxylase/aspartate 1-decarboxylase